MKNQWKSFLAGIFFALLLVGSVGTAWATVGTKLAELEYNNIRVTLDGTDVRLVDVNGDPVEPFIIDGTTYLPVRAIANAFGLHVGWDEATQTVILSSRKICNVVRVVDGDTIVVDYDGTEETVRLIGVDSPESVHPDKSKNTAAGFAASEFTTVYLTGQQVELEFDVQERDQYGRLLAYVYKDGQMFNKKLLMTGHAEISTYPPNVKYVDEFTEIIKNRDPSIPSGEYNDGYMKAPKAVYTTPAEENGMDGAFLYAEGTVKSVGELSNYDYIVIGTEFGDFALMNLVDATASTFRSIKTGSRITAGFLYVGYSEALKMGTGVYMETLQISNAPATETTTPVIPPTTSRTVYITPTGKRYHFNGSCNGGTYIPSTLEEARRRGLTPCDKCAR